MAWGGVKGERRDVAALCVAHPTTVGHRVIATGVCERTGEGEGSCSLRSDAGDECSRQKQSHEHSRSVHLCRRSEPQARRMMIVVVQVLLYAEVGTRRRGAGALQTRSQSSAALCASLSMSVAADTAIFQRIVNLMKEEILRAPFSGARSTHLHRVLRSPVPRSLASAAASEAGTRQARMLSLSLIRPMAGPQRRSAAHARSVD